VTAKPNLTGSFRVLTMSPKGRARRHKAALADAHGTGPASNNVVDVQVATDCGLHQPSSARDSLFPRRMFESWPIRNQ